MEEKKGVVNGQRKKGTSLSTHTLGFLKLGKLGLQTYNKNDERRG